ncbi:hypothetical protein QBC33DRAFT_533703 [Phialemonium atrogriseum]|uniref:Roadblock/LAMTOR2 domain-containing protein n=1 Tax=Phialemonium atrogriseum TaxID=1093897 RepID=A0AAJ0C277_9PEZI|nr:uncharacterized protein QBC33DRAFT_533703 [Phialemonium atrogriseum]KAK1768789.1 hypothetical protein QBC33DRAFT_533703 [Phialemonium atrogriseum]
MADPTISNGPDALEETIGRLSKKSGVKATLVLDRVSGAILRSSGQMASIHTPSTAGSFSSGDANNPATQQQQQQTGESQGAAEELAGLVWNFVNSAGSLVQGLDTEDEMKLLRLRTKKQELVVVPNPKYLLIVVHDTPPA